MFRLSKKLLTSNSLNYKLQKKILFNNSLLKSTSFTSNRFFSQESIIDDEDELLKFKDGKTGKLFENDPNHPGYFSVNDQQMLELTPEDLKRIMSEQGVDSIEGLEGLMQHENNIGDNDENETVRELTYEELDHLLKTMHENGEFEHLHQLLSDEIIAENSPLDPENFTNHEGNFVLPTDPDLLNPADVSAKSFLLSVGDVSEDEFNIEVKNYIDKHNGFGEYKSLEELEDKLAIIMIKRQMTLLQQELEKY